MNEIWKDVVGYEGFYKVSNFGRVFSLKNNMIMKQNKSPKGYMQLSLYKNGKMKTGKVHRLVADAFIENTFNKPQVNHLDENKENNNANNLSWVTNKENSLYGTARQRAKQNTNRRLIVEHTDFKALAAKNYKAVNQYDLQGNFIKRWNRMTSASEDTGTRLASISNCCKGKRKTTNNYKWAYAN